MALRLSKSFTRFIREPLFICLAIGLLLFLLDQILDSRDPKIIELSKSEVEQITAQWLDQMGREPLAEELAGLISERAEEAMLVREALRLGLSEDDTIIDRRLIQKLRFLVEDSAVIEPASMTDLETYFKANLSRYEEAVRISFTHRFWDSVDEEVDWELLLTRLNDDEARDRLGKPFMLGKEFKDATLQRVSNDFGDAFAAAVLQLEADSVWRGPIVSRYGVHLVRVDSTTPARQPEFESVLRRIRSDFDLERRDEAFKSFLTQLRDEYTVVLP